MLFDAASVEAAEIAGAFNKIRNKFTANDVLIDDIKTRIEALKEINESGEFDEFERAGREDYVKAVERIFKRLDDGLIFPAAALEGVDTAISNLDAVARDAQGGLRIADACSFRVPASSSHAPSALNRAPPDGCQNRPMWSPRSCAWPIRTSRTAVATAGFRSCGGIGCRSPMWLRSSFPTGSPMSGGGIRQPRAGRHDNPQFQGQVAGIRPRRHHARLCSHAGRAYLGFAVPGAGCLGAWHLSRCAAWTAHGRVAVLQVVL